MDEVSFTEGAAVLNSLIWQSQGWTHTPSANKFIFPSRTKVKVPRPEHIREKYNLFFKEAFDPKVQISKYLTSDKLPKRVVVKKLKQKYVELDRLGILKSLQISPENLRPKQVYFRQHAVRFENEPFLGISKWPFLDLTIFDDELLDYRTPDEWMSIGTKRNVAKLIPAMVYLPYKHRFSDKVTFDWQDVVVLRYCKKLNMYLVRRVTDCPTDGTSKITLKSLEAAEVGPFDDMWVPRIYISFHAEDPRLYAQRLSCAVRYRHKVEESLRFNFYIDCMPQEGLPFLDSSFIDKIIALATDIPSEFKTLKWVREKLPSYKQEMQFLYQRNLNALIYREITCQKPCLMDEIPEIWYKPSPPRGFIIDGSFKEKTLSVINKTFWTRKELIAALHVVQEQMLILLEKPMYSIPLPHTLPLDEFVVIQTHTLKELTEYLNSTWMQNVTIGIKEKLRFCGKGYYNIEEDDWYIYEHSKLKKFMTVVSFMMQDTTRTLVISALAQYTSLFAEACHNVMEIPDDFEWTEGFNSNNRGPLKGPLFQIEAVLRSIHLEFADDLQKYHNLVIKLFNDALLTTVDIPHPEMFVMENMLIAERLILETVGAQETRVVAWRDSLIIGMNKAILAMKAYAKSYDSALSCLAMDQITYIKTCERQKKKYSELKELIEYHMMEKKLLSENIPDSVNIGPFRLVTRGVKLAAVKKHEILAAALLEYFSLKLHTYMEDIQNKFNNLQEQIKQPAGNIEYLLEQKRWLEETAAGDIEELALQVKQLRQDYRQLADFYCAFSDEEFTLYWELIGLPYSTITILENRIENLDSERDYLLKLLILDQDHLETSLTAISDQIDSFYTCLDLTKFSSLQLLVRKTRKEIENDAELSKLYNMREMLFGIPTTDYSKVDKLSSSLEPYESLWYPIADFYRWRERDQSETDMEIDEEQLRTSIDESYTKLNNALSIFSEGKFLRIIYSVQDEMDKYRFSRFGIEIPVYNDRIDLSDLDILDTANESVDSSEGQNKDEDRDDYEEEENKHSEDEYGKDKNIANTNVEGKVSESEESKLDPDHNEEQENIN